MQEHKDLTFPYLQVKDVAGNWKTVIEDMGIPSGKPKTMAVDLTGKSPITDKNGQQLRERDWLVTLPREDGSVMYLLFISPDRDFSRLRPTFEHMLRTVHMK